MLSNALTSVLSLIVLGTLIQGLPQLEDSPFGGPVRGPLRPVEDLPNPPPPPAFVGAMLLNDAARPFIAPKKGDLRGPCPGLNTLANHGVSLKWLPRDGVATPAQMVIAVQEGFNMRNDRARGATYTAHLLNGNLEYDLLSIGGKTPKTGPDPPAPAVVGGLNTHDTFEGDASMTRADAFFGDNFSFNAPLFEQFKNFSMVYGNGFWNDTVAAEFRFHRIQESIRNNPEFEILGHRHGTAYGEASFPAAFFVDGRKTGSEAGQLDMVAAAELFFKDGRFPNDFHRPSAPVDGSTAGAIFLAHPTEPGRNVNGVNTFQVDHTLPSGILDPCGFYQGFVNQKVVPLYPNPTGLLRKNLIKNLQFFYDTNGFDGTCDQVFPYGQE
ncbi:Chloroperoxidase [Coprinopsis sp. MPI-PUGE-AT-0042]|nr:Chloroperoxidase [Coprinopsis sp. MPI-PUGE-AT-0042]